MLDILEFILETFKLSSLEKTSKTLIQKILKIKNLLDQSFGSLLQGRKFECFQNELQNV